MNTFFWGQNKIAALNVITVGNTGFNNGQASPYSYNNNGDCLFFSATNNINDGPTSVTYGGVAMTQIGTSTYNSTAARYLTLWILVNPPQGVNNFVYNGTTANMYKGFVSMKGVNQTTPYSNYTLTSGTTANLSITSPATTIDNTYIFAWIVYYGGGATAGTDTTLVLNVVGAASYYFMKTTPVATAGSTGTINTISTSGGYTSKLIQLNPK